MNNEIMSGALEYAPDYLYNFVFDLVPFRMSSGCLPFDHNHSCLPTLYQRDVWRRRNLVNIHYCAEST